MVAAPVTQTARITGLPRSPPVPRVRHAALPVRSAKLGLHNFQLRARNDKPREVTSTRLRHPRGPVGAFYRPRARDSGRAPRHRTHPRTGCATHNRQAFRAAHRAARRAGPVVPPCAGEIGAPVACPARCLHRVGDTRNGLFRHEGIASSPAAGRPSPNRRPATSARAAIGAGPVPRRVAVVPATSVPAGGLRDDETRT